MTVATLKASSSTELMKSDGNDTVDTVIKQTIGKDPLLSFSRAVDSPAQWIQLLHALDQQGTCDLSIDKFLEGGGGHFRKHFSYSQLICLLGLLIKKCLFG